MAGTAVLGLTLAACGSSDDDPDATDTNSTSPSASTPESSAPPTLTNDKCAAGATSADSFKVGGILPITGNLAYLGPPEIAGLGLAVSELNAAGGINGAAACHQVEDSGDTLDLAVSSNSADKLIQGDPSVVIGAASSSVTENVVQTFADAQITEVSPANTATSLSGVSPFYFRTVVPDGVQGNALATLIAGDGYQKLAFVVFNDTYGTGLRNEIEKNFTADGAGVCTYGCKGDGDEFSAGQTTFSTEVSGAIASNPDAIMILAFDETKAIVPELVAQGWDMSKSYLSDGNTADFSEDLPPGSMTGAQGTIPGADASEDFKANLSAWNEMVNGDPLSDYAYAAESYDAVILAALAAVKGGSNDSVTVKDNYAAVSGATDGEVCTSFEDCVALLEAGSEIKYSGPSGIGPLNDQNDPASGFVGIYSYDDQNKNSLVQTIEGVS